MTEPLSGDLGIELHPGRLGMGDWNQETWKCECKQDTWDHSRTGVHDLILVIALPESTALDQMRAPATQPEIWMSPGFRFE
jgi:hypothetical protein